MNKRNDDHQKDLYGDGESDFDVNAESSEDSSTLASGQSVYDDADVNSENQSDASISNTMGSEQENNGESYDAVSGIGNPFPKSRAEDGRPTVVN